MKPKWLREAEECVANMPEAAREIREAAENDLYFFAKLVNPGYVYGDIHRQLFRWMQKYNLYGLSNTVTSNKLVMLPRAHLKSHMVATWCAWMVARHPEITILYVSATAELAISQLYDTKN
jgi:pheromone shutdown protein TraB